ncbi:MAG: glycyl-radical enzyme activating protein [Lachnospiraceae bacterium]|nr:glycyl-radical enzyme activating protein [Lachnospiraceae bacterium]
METKGIVFNIQRFSIHDGPGIRTTVFLKGCPLNCRWCANPESKAPHRELLHTEKTCVHCGSCVAVCPNHALTLEEGRLVQKREKCAQCFACAKACPVHALQVEGDVCTVEELLVEVKKDEAFYKKSGGGVTLSGGEPLLQREFTLAFLKRLKAEGMHTTIETTGFASPEYFRSILEYVDMLYIDCKHPDSAEHERMTDVPNERVLENLEYAAAAGQEMVVRIPVIPHFNDAPEVTRQYIDLFRSIHIKQVHLLPFHQLGLAKWRALGQPYLFENEQNMKKEMLLPMKAMFEAAGIQAQIGG